jgi:hypothetical protein
LNSINENNKICRTCSELSPVEFEKCQYCGSELKDLVEDMNSDLDLKITIGRKTAEKEVEEINSPEILRYVNNEIHIDETDEKPVSSIIEDQVQFNDIFGFKTTNEIPERTKKAVKELKEDSISNNRKVLLTIICSIIPGFGQLFCLILSIGFMNSEENDDRKSFGNALFVASLVMFVITCIVSFLIAVAVYQPTQL